MWECFLWRWWWYAKETEDFATSEVLFKIRRGESEGSVVSSDQILVSHRRHCTHLHLLHGLLLRLHLRLHLGHLLAHGGLRWHKVVNIVVHILSVLVDHKDSCCEQSHIESHSCRNLLLEHRRHIFRVHLWESARGGSLLALTSLFARFLALLGPRFFTSLAHCYRFFELGSLIILVHILPLNNKQPMQETTLILFNYFIYNLSFTGSH